MPGHFIPLGGQPRLDYHPWGLTRPGSGVEALSQSSNATNPDTAAQAPRRFWQIPGFSTIGPNKQNPMLGRTGRGFVRAAPSVRMGPIPKLSFGTGQTNLRAFRARSYSPAGSGTQDVTPTAGLEMMPYRRDSFDASPVGIPLRGVAATSGQEFFPTYKSHDWSWVPRFFKHGRMPGPWQETAFGPGYRYLQPVQTPIRYNPWNAVQLARPLSRNAYFLGYQTTDDAYARIGAGGAGVRPLGY